MRRRDRLPTVCWLLLAPVGALYAFGLVRLHYNLPVFAAWIREDGLVEWVTFALLAAMGALALARAPAQAAPARLWWLAFGLGVLFCAGEEISWGQRLFGWHSSEWFVAHNAQDETNLHNLVVGGIKLNKLVFGSLLGIGAALYLAGSAVSYRRSPALRAFLDERALPVPRNYQLALAAVAWTLAELARAVTGKAGELQEVGLVAILAVILLHPLNEASAPALTRRAEALRERAGAALARWAGSWLTPNLCFLLRATALLVLVFAAFRLAFAAAFEPPWLLEPAGEIIKDRGVFTLHAAQPSLATPADVMRAWTLGLRFDLRIALLLLLPFALLGGLRPFDPARAAPARGGWRGYFVVALGGAFALHALDLAQYAYEAERLNASLFDHAREGAIAAGMVWQTYPVVGIVAALGLLVGATSSRLVRWLPGAPDAGPSPRWRRQAIGAAAIALYALGIHGQWSQYPLRWSNAYFTPNAYLTALASNPLQTLFDSLRSPLPDVDAQAACAAATQLAPHYGLPPCAAPPPSFARRVEPAAPARPNVVVVILESFSAYKTGAMGNPLDPTPQFDALARDSLLYTRFYSAARPTARSLFSVLFGVPDVSPARSASRNVRMVRQHTLVNAFAGYRKHYFIGGSASWGNVRGMLAHNVPDLRLHEGEYSDLPGNDVWGASDLALLEQAHGVLAAERAPFLAFIQTAGNHRPYTIPADARGFARVARPASQLAAAGFEEPDAYDGMRFMDHALGRFLELARAAPYYEDTIFVFFGDHGSPSRRFPPHEQELRRLHVPLVLHSPRWLGPGRRIGAPASSLDVLPTLAALAGVPHVNTALGRDLLAARPESSQFAFLASTTSRGLVDAGYFYARDAAGRETLRRLLPDGALEPEDVAAREAPRLEDMARLAGAMQDSAGWLLLHNPPQE